MMTVAVIGGGASGMMAALAAASRGATVSVYERQSRVGRKLAVTGNGRCNLTNLHASMQHYHGAEPAFVLPALQQYGAAETLRCFRELGLLTTAQPDGRVYPLSDTAGSVVDVLRYAMDAAGVKLFAGCEVSRIRKASGRFLISLAEGTATADRVIIACGGAAGGRFGGTAAGYRLLQGFGHSCTSLGCSLVQLRSDNEFCRSLKGIRADAALRLFDNKRCLAESAGEVQFTDYGLSGPAVFEISRAALEKPGLVVSLDLLRQEEEEAIIGMLLQRAADTPQLTLGEAFIGMVQNRIGKVLVSAAGFRPSAPITGMDSEAAGKLAHAAKHFEFRITGDLGMDNAQVTAGGIAVSEFDPNSLESRLCPGLFACGEVLDVDGDCGGYNLQWAWSSGKLAGIAAAGD